MFTVKYYIRTAADRHKNKQRIVGIGCVYFCEYSVCRIPWCRIWWTDGKRNNWYTRIRQVWNIGLWPLYLISLCVNRPDTRRLLYSIHCRWLSQSAVLSAIFNLLLLPKWQRRTLNFELPKSHGPTGSAGGLITHLQGIVLCASERYRIQHLFCYWTSSKRLFLLFVTVCSLMKFLKVYIAILFCSLSSCSELVFLFIPPFDNKSQ